MNIRLVQEYDIERLKELHQRLGFDYRFPNLNEFFPISTVVSQNDFPVMTVACLPTVELFFLVDNEWETPGIRMEAFKKIHEHVRQDLKSKGIAEANAWIPPQVSRSFGRRLMKMGWDHNRDWPCFSRRTDHV